MQDSSTMREDRLQQSEHTPPRFRVSMLPMLCLHPMLVKPAVVWKRKLCNGTATALSELGKFEQAHSDFQGLFTTPNQPGKIAKPYMPYLQVDMPRNNSVRRLHSASFLQ